VAEFVADKLGLIPMLVAPPRPELTDIDVSTTPATPAIAEHDSPSR
jgi:hypothetical protein